MAKLSDKEFLSALRESAGLYARTVRFIAKEYGITITRQGVRDRALKHPAELVDIKEQNKDIAEEGLYSLMRSKSERIKLRACTEYLSFQAKDRGYVKRTEIDQPVDQEPFRSEMTPITFGDEDEED